MKYDRYDVLILGGVMLAGGVTGVIWEHMLGQYDVHPSLTVTRKGTVLPSPLVSAAPSAWAVVSPPRPYLTPQIEEYMARDQCSITKQRCRASGVCMTCMVCPHEGRNLLGSSFTKCKSPTDCIELTDNVAWTREKVDPGWCEGMPFEENP